MKVTAWFFEEQRDVIRSSVIEKTGIIEAGLFVNSFLGN
jgi:hypothetical protein